MEIVLSQQENEPHHLQRHVGQQISKLRNLCVFEPEGVGHGDMAANLGTLEGFCHTEQQLNFLRCTRRTYSNNAAQAILPESRMLASHEAKQSLERYSLSDPTGWNVHHDIISCFFANVPLTQQFSSGTLPFSSI